MITRNTTTLSAVEQSYAHRNPHQFGLGDLNMPSKVEAKLVGLEGDQFAFGEYGKLDVGVNGRNVDTWSAFNPKTNELFMVDANAHVIAHGTVSLAADGSGTVCWS